VDGLVITRLGTTVDPQVQQVEVDGRPVKLREPNWIALHKPARVACTRTDPEGRSTVYDFIPSRLHHLFHVGRLDFMSEGLLLLSNEGDVAHRLLHPSREVKRRYVISLVGPAPANLPQRLISGIQLSDGEAVAREADWIVGPKDKAPEIGLTLTEGRNREIRRMFAALDLKVRTLRRIAFGPIQLGNLPPGIMRMLSDGERASLYRIA
jgi:23S rRNA pseudouridine2605 synthase